MHMREIAMPCATLVARNKAQSCSLKRWDGKIFRSASFHFPNCKLPKGCVRQNPCGGTCFSSRLKRSGVSAETWRLSRQTKKAGAKPHRPSSHRYSYQCQYIRGQKQKATAAIASDRHVPALISNADSRHIDIPRMKRNDNLWFCYKGRIKTLIA